MRDRQHESASGPTTATPWQTLARMQAPPRNVMIQVRQEAMTRTNAIVTSYKPTPC